MMGMRVGVWGVGGPVSFEYCGSPIANNRPTHILLY